MKYLYVYGFSIIMDVFNYIFIWKFIIYIVFYPCTSVIQKPTFILMYNENHTDVLIKFIRFSLVILVVQNYY